MKLILFLLLLSLKSLSQVDTSYLSVCSWNIQNFGKSKSESELLYIAQKVKSFDIVAIQEVSTSEWGAKTIALLDDYLDRTGSSWDYIISDATLGDGSERYAFLYKKHRVKLKSHHLVQELQIEIGREPFLAKFIFHNLEYTFYNLHLVPTAKKPQLEVLKLGEYFNQTNSRIIILGDFNLGSSDKSFYKLKTNFTEIFISEKTSLKMKPSTKGEVLNLPYDNFFVSRIIKSKNAEVILFYKDFKTLEEARKISDHCPIKILIK